MSLPKSEVEPTIFIIDYRGGEFKSIPVVSKKTSKIEIFSKVLEALRIKRR